MHLKVTAKQEISLKFTETLGNTEY